MYFSERRPKGESLKKLNSCTHIMTMAFKFGDLVYPGRQPGRQLAYYYNARVKYASSTAADYDAFTSVDIYEDVALGNEILRVMASESLESATVFKTGQLYGLLRTLVRLTVVTIIADDTTESMIMEFKHLEYLKVDNYTGNRLIQLPQTLVSLQIGANYRPIDVTTVQTLTGLIDLTITSSMPTMSEGAYLPASLRVLCIYSENTESYRLTRDPSLTSLPPLCMRNMHANFGNSIHRGVIRSYLVLGEMWLRYCTLPKWNSSVAFINGDCWPESLEGIEHVEIHSLVTDTLRRFSQFGTKSVRAVVLRGNNFDDIDWPDDTPFATGLDIFIDHMTNSVKYSKIIPTINASSETLRELRLRKLTAAVDLAKMTRLESLTINGQPTMIPPFLHSSLRILSLWNAECTDWTFIYRLTGLCELLLARCDISYLDNRLNGLENLEKLSVIDCACQMSEGIGYLPQMRWLVWRNIHHNEVVTPPRSICRLIGRSDIDVRCSMITSIDAFVTVGVTNYTDVSHIFLTPDEAADVLRNPRCPTRCTCYDHFCQRCGVDATSYLGYLPGDVLREVLAYATEYVYDRVENVARIRSAAK